MESDSDGGSEVCGPGDKNGLQSMNKNLTNDKTNVKRQSSDSGQSEDSPTCSNNKRSRTGNHTLETSSSSKEKDRDPTQTASDVDGISDDEGVGNNTTQATEDIMNSPESPEPEAADSSGDESWLGFYERAHFRRLLNPTEQEEEVEPEEMDLEEDKCGLTDEMLAPPSHKWSVIPNWRQREYKYKPRIQPNQFRINAYGARHFVERFELMAKLEGHNGCVNCLHFNSSGTLLASGSDDTNIAIWDWEIQKPKIVFDSGHTMNVFQAKIMPLSGDCHLVSCARDGQIRLAELSTQGLCKNTRKLAQHKGSAHKLALDSQSPHVLYSCAEDSVVFQIDLRDPKPNKILSVKGLTGRHMPIALYSISTHPIQSNYFCTSGREPYVRIYDTRNTQNPVKKFCPHILTNGTFKANATCSVFNYDGTEILASYNDDDIYSFNTEHSDGADYVRKFSGHRNSATVKAVNWFGLRSEFVVSGSDCGNIFLWETKSQKIVKFMAGDEGGVVNVLEPHPTSPILATSGLDHDVKIWVPSCEHPQFDTRELRKIIARNRVIRERERRESSDSMDTSVLMRLVAAAARRARRQRGDNRDTSSDNDSDSVDDNSDGSNLLPCRTS